ncbi:restriction endonuclease [Marinilactibacillus psychrotolerans]|uniref:5-methylcytosine restriction system specificity protein McrC n=1 Tax=Marinilactibacillus psychrotolerans TaxID=191770 RepID=UPI0038871CB5
MIANDKIPIRNIYYMLSYAYKALNLSEYNRVSTEEFHNVKDLYTAILKIGIPVLIRGGLIKDYLRVSEKTTVIRGKIDINDSIKQHALTDKKLIVLYDEFSEDTLLNQIIKATLIYLVRAPKISKEDRKFFYGLIPYFSEVSELELSLNVWKRVRYNRQNIRYQFIVDICRYLYEELLLDENVSSNMMRQIQDEQRLSSLYENFVFAFYKRETNFKVSRPQIPWKVDNGYFDALPVMQTDIVLNDGEKTLIIDTKFYSENMATRFEGGQAKQKSANLYQIFSYVNNWVPQKEEEVAGMLLYARTTADQQPNHHYEINGKKISVVNVNLNQEFTAIKKELIDFVTAYFE